MGDVRQGQFGLQQRSAGRHCGDAGDDLEGNVPFAQLADLLANRAVQARVAGMHTCHVLAFGMGGLDQVDDLLQVQFGAVDHLFRLMAVQYRCGY